MMFITKPNPSALQADVADIEGDLFVHAETIMAWIQSCVNDVQLPVCENAIKSLYEDKFMPAVEAGKLDRLVFLITLSNLRSVLFDQERKIKYYQ